MTDQTAAERIIAAAAELFAERGYSATTTRALSERAGVNEVTIFRLFGSKLGVVGAVGERLMSQGAVQRARSAPLPDDLRGAVRELAAREVADATANGAVSMRLAFDAHSVPELAAAIGDGPSVGGRAIVEFFREQQRLGRVRTDMDASIIADAFFALTSSYVMSRMLLSGIANSNASAEETVAHLVDVFLRGIETKG